MSRHARRSELRAAGRLAKPLAAAGLGIAQLGMLGVGVASAAPAAPSPAPASGQSATPCDVKAKACVKLSSHEVWVTDGAGKVLRGPIRMNDGEEGSETPTGTFHVQRKHRYHVSQEQEGASMPYAVFFDGNGRALHQGDPASESVGCVRMAQDDAAFVFDHLDIHDMVQIVE